VAQLQALSGHSSSKLLRLIHRWLKSPPLQKKPLVLAQYIVFDGSFVYKRTRAVVALIDGYSGKLITCQYGVKENSKSELVTFFRHLQVQGLAPISCTVDGNPHVVKALRKVWPTILIQRCRVHVQRQGLMWCRASPKTAMAQQLRGLFMALLTVKTEEQKTLWLQKVEIWEKRYGHVLHGPVHGWVMSDLKRARSMLLKAIPYLFHYLANPFIPATTNRAEGFFSRLKRSYKRHTGLAHHQRKNFILWFCSFYQSP